MIHQPSTERREQQRRQRRDREHETCEGRRAGALQDQPRDRERHHGVAEARTKIGGLQQQDRIQTTGHLAVRA
jgi:hypothetical protein